MHPQRHSLLDVEQVDGVTVVKLVGPELVNDEEIDVLAEFLYGSVEQAGARSLVLDFHDVKLVGTSTWGILLQLLKIVNGRKGRLALCGFHDYLRETIELLQLNQIFSIYENEEAALNSFQ